MKIHKVIIKIYYQQYTNWRSYSINSNSLLPSNDKYLSINKDP